MPVEIEYGVTQELEIECNICGRQLDAQFSKLTSGDWLSIEPCDICLEAAKDEARGECT